ncbi:murein transglycosylase domain-containing protein [Endothiovibrio diazotrophicus]
MAAIAAITSGCKEALPREVASLATSGSPRAALEGFAKRKATQYATNPTRLVSDLKELRQALRALAKLVKGEWGEQEARTPTPTQYVKYTQNYLSRALVDFDSGTVRVETLDQGNPTESLKNAIVTTLLTPGDPRAVDLFSAGEVRLSGRPYLADEVLDHEGKAVLYPWRANRFADWLIANRLQTRNVDTPNGTKAARYVEIRMVSDHLQVRAAKYQPLVQRYAQRFDVSANLINAIIKTESDFNPFAVSAVPAFGLMQIVPTTAGRDALRHLGTSGTPSRDELFDPERNIELGSAYLQLLDDNYLKKVSDPVSREYCAIAAYNGGIGNVYRSFSSDRSQAFDQINRLAPAAVYQRLQAKMPAETQRYLRKVLDNKRQFVRA